MNGGFSIGFKTSLVFILSPPLGRTQNSGLGLCLPSCKVWSYLWEISCVAEFCSPLQTDSICTWTANFFRVSGLVSSQTSNPRRRYSPNYIFSRWFFSTVRMCERCHHLEFIPVVKKTIQKANRNNRLIFKSCLLK